MIMMVIIIVSLFHLKEKWVPHMDNNNNDNNIKQSTPIKDCFKSAQQHGGKVNTSSIIKQNIYYLWKCTVN